MEVVLVYYVNNPYVRLSCAEMALVLAAVNVVVVTMVVKRIMVDSGD